MTFFSTLKAFDRLMSLLWLVLICSFILHKRIISNTTLVVFHDSVREQFILEVLAFVELLHTCGKMFIFTLKFLDLISKPFIIHNQIIVEVIVLCKENGPWAIWLNEFWCLIINTIRELMFLVVFVFVVHRMLELLGPRN
jgi:hypothetical protein